MRLIDTLTDLAVSAIYVVTMPKTQPKAPAPVSIKLTLTQEDADLIAAAMKAEDERMTATWVRKVALRAARAALAEKKGGRR